MCVERVGATVKAHEFELPTGGASVSEAVLIPADAATGMPEFCRVRGAIASENSVDPPILFQVNLPSAWNHKTVQYGGAGRNGVLIEATGAFMGAGGLRPALARGYVTYGSDAGHQGAATDYSWSTVAVLNNGYEAVKRSFDVAAVLTRRYYGREARWNYHIGGSKGGQEAIHAAQRYFKDFDGVVSYFPAAQNQSLTIAWNRMWHFAFNTPGGALNVAKQGFLKRSVLASCDALDGAADGIVSNTKGCGATFKVETLRCSGGADTGDTCLSDAQIAALKDAATPFEFAYPMTNGVKSVGPFPVLLGGSLQLWMGDGSDGTQQAFFQGRAPRPEALSATGIDLETWNAGVLRAAEMFDASNPDLDGFKGRNGKMLLVQGTIDLLVPPSMTDHYYEAIRSRYGVQVRDFVRYYVIPGYGHGQGDFTSQWDALSVLEAWVEGGQAPGPQTVADISEQTKGRTRPLCEYPSWPRYAGSGDINAASSFNCSGD